MSSRRCLASRVGRSWRRSATGSASTSRWTTGAGGAAGPGASSSGPTATATRRCPRRHRTDQPGAPSERRRASPATSSACRRAQARGHHPLLLRGSSGVAGGRDPRDPRAGRCAPASRAARLRAHRAAQAKTRSSRRRRGRRPRCLTRTIAPSCRAKDAWRRGDAGRGSTRSRRPIGSAGSPGWALSPRMPAGQTVARLGAW